MQCATAPETFVSSSAAASTAPGGATKSPAAPSASEITYRTWVARGLLNAASEASRDLLSRVLEAAVDVVTRFDSRGSTVSAVSASDAAAVSDGPFSSANDVLSALYRFPLDHDLMALLKADATRTAECSAREARELAKDALRTQNRCLELLEVSCRRAACGI